jgi:hypothetical protein
VNGRGLVVGLLAAVLACWAGPALAVPSGGASPDTAGTSVSVSPKTLPAGATISFRVTGFPAGEVVYVKIDDGGFCSRSGVHGACVVHQQRIPASGPVSGSLVLPADLKPGAHWLRFLASKEMHAANGTYVGVKGYTLRGASDFTVTAGPGGSSTRSGLPTTTPTAAPAGVAVPEDTTAGGAAAAGATLEVTPAPADPAPEATSASTAPAQTAAAPPPVIRQESVDQRFPVVGVAGLAVLCAMAGGLVLRNRRG